MINVVTRWSWWSVAARYRGRLAILLACVLCAIAPASAMAQVTVTGALSADRVSVGDSVVLHVVVEGAGSATPSHELEIAGCDVAYLGGQNQSSQSISIINGVRREQRNERYVMQYRITPLRAGVVRVPPVEVDAGGEKRATAPLTLNASEAKEDADFRLDLTLEKSECYEGEAVGATLTWYLANTDVRDFRVSGFDGGDEFDIVPAPGSEELSRQLPDRANLPFLGGVISGRLARETIGGRQYATLTSQLLITPKKSGPLKVGPLRVSFAVRIGDRPSGFFDWPLDDGGQRERRVATSRERELRVRALPSEGRPSDFAGLVGRFSLSAGTDAQEANVGDPLTLTLRVEGTPPLSRVRAPMITRDEAFTSRFRMDPEGWKEVPGATRTFTTTIRPTSDGVREVPAISLPYFDVSEGAYRVASSRPIPLAIRSTREVTAADAVRSGGASEPAPRDARPLIAGSGGLRANYALDTLASGETLWAPTRGQAALAGAAMLVPPAVMGIVAWRGRARGKAIELPARIRSATRRATRRARGADSPEAIGEAIRACVAEIRGAAPAAVTSADCSALGTWAGELAGVLSECERARFGESPAALDGLRSRAVAALERAGRAPAAGVAE